MDFGIYTHERIRNLMIFVTSDLHADKTRFKNKSLKKLKKTDILIILGDFGFIWEGGKKEKRILKWIGSRKYQVLFIDGTHENFDLLDSYPQVDFMGGKARHISKKLHHLMRGEVYNMENSTVLCFGGGESLDKETRVEGETWWQTELPTQQDFENCNKNIEKHNGKIDYILTHDAPTKLTTFLNLNQDIVIYEKTPVENYFDDIYSRVDYKRWLFGKHHKDQKMGNKYVAVFKNVLPLN